ncbi:MAG: DUF433 domain-containing protein [Chloroflexi bacterium]|nr:DUF433 domain-containing protein [Chloroflexota bacterium]
MLGRYIVADSASCHGEPTFRGTRIMVWQVLEMVAAGLAWETIIAECHNSITKDAIVEAVSLSGEERPLGSSAKFWQLITERRDQKTISRSELEHRIKQKRT